MRFLVFPILFLAFQASLTAQIDEYAWIWEDLQALEGSWFRPTDKGDYMEVWERLDDSTLVGRGFRVKIEDFDTVSTEYLTLKKRGTEVYFSAQVRRQNDNEEVEYTLTEAEGSTFTFENPTVDYPKKVQYILLDKREIIVRKEGIRTSTGREKTEEFQFQREFAASKFGFRVYAGGNYSNLIREGALGVSGSEAPIFNGGYGWDVGFQYMLDGRGGFASVAFDLSLSGRYNSTQTNFWTQIINNGDTSNVNFIRDATYNQFWGTLAVLPHLHIIREGKLSLYAGPFVSRAFNVSAQGTVLPAESPDEGLRFSGTDDLKKRNIGLIGGAVIGLNPWKKDLGGQLGLRVTYGLGNVDNLYEKLFDPISASGTIRQVAFHVNYSIDLMKI